MNKLVITNLHVSVEGKEILKGLNLTVPHGEVHAIMGPNGSGKSTLASTLLGHPKYVVTEGDIVYKGQSVLALSADKRAQLGLFLSFQYPQEISGISITNFLRTAYHAVHPDAARISVAKFYALIQEKIAQLKMDPALAERSVNEGFSGGEKKRAEILQLAVLEPSLAVLDETDSGLDIDALRQVSDGINALRSPDRGFLLITHYQRLLEYVKPDVIHVLVDGRIVKTGGAELAQTLEKTGYATYEEKETPPAS